MWKIKRKDKFLNSGMMPEDMEDNFDWEEDDELNQIDDDFGSDHDLGGTGHGDDSLSDADNYL